MVAQETQRAMASGMFGSASRRDARKALAGGCDPRSNISSRSCPQIRQYSAGSYSAFCMLPSQVRAEMTGVLQVSELSQPVRQSAAELSLIEGAAPKQRDHLVRPARQRPLGREPACQLGKNSLERYPVGSAIPPMLS